MSRTRKDSRYRKETVIELTKKQDGTFDLFLNRELNHNGLDEIRLADVLCRRFGYCGHGFDEILFELNKNGRAERRFGNSF
jgi:hypothetical protein